MVPGTLRPLPGISTLKALYNGLHVSGNSTYLENAAFTKGGSPVFTVAIVDVGERRYHLVIAPDAIGWCTHPYLGS